jgi:hypothetical protein
MRGLNWVVPLVAGKRISAARAFRRQQWADIARLTLQARRQVINEAFDAAEKALDEWTPRSVRITEESASSPRGAPGGWQARRQARWQRFIDEASSGGTARMRRGVRRNVVADQDDT